MLISSHVFICEYNSAPFAAGVKPLLPGRVEFFNELFELCAGAVTEEEDLDA
jgi:hypothetical protein